MGCDSVVTKESLNAAGGRDPLDFNSFTRRYESIQCGREKAVLPRGFVIKPSEINEKVLLKNPND